MHLLKACPYYQGQLMEKNGGPVFMSGRVHVMNVSWGFVYIRFA